MKNLLRTLLLGLTAAAATIAYAAAGPKETAQTFFESLINGDASKAASLVYLPPEAEQQGITEQVMLGKLGVISMELREEIKKEGGSITVVSSEPTYTNAAKTEAKVPVTLKMRDKSGKTEEDKETLDLIKTDKGWKIQLH